MKYIIEDMETGRKVFAEDRIEAEALYVRFCMTGNDTQLRVVNDDGTENWIKIYYGGRRR